MIRLVLGIWFVLCSIANAQLSGGLQFPGPGLGSSASYQGPVDAANLTGVIVTHYWSCSRVASLALASTSTNLCDLVKTSDGTSVCTLRGSANGYVDLSNTYCGGSTPSSACSGFGGCSISKAYNQINSGIADMVNSGATSTKPTITFSALNSLPVITFANASSQQLSTSSSITRSSPFSMSAVFNRSTVNAGGYLAGLSTAVELRGSASSNTMVLACGTAVAVGSGTITDSQWHAANASCVTSVGQDAIRVDGTDTTGVTAGTSGFSAETVRMGVSNGGVFVGASIAEAMLMSSALDATGRSNVNTNQHSSTNGYNF